MKYPNRKPGTIVTQVKRDSEYTINLYFYISKKRNEQKGCSEEETDPESYACIKTLL